MTVETSSAFHSFKDLFIHSRIYIAPLQGNYSEVPNVKCTTVKLKTTENKNA